MALPTSFFFDCAFPQVFSWLSASSPLFPYFCSLSHCPCRIFVQQDPFPFRLALPTRRSRYVRPMFVLQLCKHKISAPPLLLRFVLCLPLNVSSRSVLASFELHAPLPNAKGSKLPLVCLVSMCFKYSTNLLRLLPVCWQKTDPRLEKTQNY